MIRSIAASILSLAFAAGVAAQERPPKVFVDEGACPFECCQYGRWTTAKNTQAFASPRAKRATLTIPAGTEVTALTGYVRTVGQAFAVSREHPPYKPGDKLMVYTYYGEGLFLVWRDGEMVEEDLGFSPYGGTGGERCTDEKYCWGTLSGQLKSDWWAQVRLADGKAVWVDAADGFEGQDGCG